MAIKDFKEIVDRRGYKVNSEDRKIFEREIGKSYFGSGNSDMIEFILYDINDNKLPQGEDGKLVRYINLTDSNIKNYFLISDNNFTKKLNGASEFIVDIEKLVREAGYSNGIFKTQVTLLNRRAGSEIADTDKLWIHEISPSRTEIRILPLKNKKQPNLDLEKRYNTFVNKQQFRDDTVYYAKQYIEDITTQKIIDTFSRIKGKQQDTEIYYSLIRKEFKIESIEIFIQKVRDKFIESMTHFIDGREWNINNINYGKPKDKLDTIELSIQTINQVFEESLTIVLQYCLPKRTYQEETELTIEQQVTFDAVKEILKSSVSNTLYPSTEPNRIDALIRGCKDSTALNFNPQAQEDDGSCRYSDVNNIIEVKGCTNASALNYNPLATMDDGSCKYNDRILQKTQTYYVWSDRASIKYKDNGILKTLEGIECDSFNISHDDDTIKWSGDVRIIPKIKVPTPIMVSYQITNKSTMNMVAQPMDNMYSDPYRNMGFSSFNPTTGFTGYYYENSFQSENTLTFRGQSLTFQYKDSSGNLKTSTELQPNGITTVCAELGSLLLPAGLVSVSFGECGTDTTTSTSFSTNMMVDQGNQSIGGGGGGFSNSQGESENEFQYGPRNTQQQR